MRLNEVYEKLQGLNIFEKRVVNDELIELVFEGKEAEAWYGRFASLLGEALKPAGAKSNARANHIAKDLGGIRPEQSLYVKAFEDHLVVAVFWPWSNGRCITCKVFRVETPKTDAPADAKGFWSKLFGKQGS